VTSFSSCLPRAPVHDEPDGRAGFRRLRRTTARERNDGGGSRSAAGGSPKSASRPLRPDTRSPYGTLDARQARQLSTTVTEGDRVVIRVEPFAVPEPGPNEVVVEMQAISINPSDRGSVRARRHRDLPP